MSQPDDKTQWVSQAEGQGDASANRLGERIAEAFKRLANLLFPVPGGGRQAGTSSDSNTSVVQ